MADRAASPPDTSARDRIAIRRALVSVSDKTGLADLAAALDRAGVEIVSTGSTAATIRAAGRPVTEVSDLTGFPESLDGRVKTLHPAVHAGLLADLRREDHVSQLAALGIAPFELVIVNLYPFAETAAAGAEGEAVIEQIDIGGPALVRAAAKNHANVAVVVSPESYPAVSDALAAGGTTLTERRELAARAFAHTADYDRAVADWFTGGAAAATASADPPQHLTIRAERLATLRYGENAHQRAAIYRRPGGRGIAQAVQLQGKEMSYNNYVDADAAVRAAFDQRAPAVAIVKHTNPCGIALASPGAPDPIADAHRRAHACDPVSAFGGVVAANRPVTAAMAQTLRDIFTEVVVAPGFEAEARQVLAGKKNLRLLSLPADWQPESRELRAVSGGLLVQDADRFTAGDADPDAWELVSGDRPDAATMADLAFAWIACRAVKSNAIVLARDGATVGVGMGQVNRVDSCRLAVERAGERARGSVAASDAFFPFADGPQALLDAGVAAIVQPGGSVRDDETIALARERGIPMLLTGVRHFSH